MFSLTLREQTLIAAVLVALAAGAVIHHLRTRAAEGISTLAKPAASFPQRPQHP